MKKIICIFVLLFILSNVSAEVLRERTLDELQVSGLIITSARERDCFEFPILRGDNDLTIEKYTVLSLHTLFSPNNKGRAFLEVFVNDENVQKINSRDIQKDWVRIVIPNKYFLEENNLRVCGNLGFGTTEIRILKDSKIGVYKMPDFSKEDSFTKEVNNANPKVNTPVNVTIKVKNYGSEGANVILNYLKLEKKDVQISSGDTEYTGFIPPFDYDTNKPGEYSFSYSLFPEKALTMTLPGATLSYYNIFDDEVILRSTRPNLKVKKQESKISIVILTEKEINYANETIPLTYIVKNTSNTIVRNVLVAPLFNGENIGKEEKVLNLDSGESFTFNVPISSNRVGTFEAGCNARYDDENRHNFLCDQKLVFFSTPNESFIWHFGVLFALIGVLAYLFIYFRK